MNRWIYNTEEQLFKVMKAIKNGMTEPWEYRERFGSKATTISKLIAKKYITYQKKVGYRITPEGEAFLQGSK